MNQVQPLQITAGPLQALFEPSTGMLRYVLMGETEVLRGIYVSVRDENWDTIEPVISSLTAKETSPSENTRDSKAIEIRFESVCRRGQIDFVWQGCIRGSSDGTLRYEMRGEARTSFTKNRIGFCVLHPIRECAGAPCTVTHVDGTVTRSRFPGLISPHQPFYNVRAIRHQVCDTVEVEVLCTGDVFEMEDQRNWTDASYKTYCTPLAEPFPVSVAAGQRFEQAIRVSLFGKPHGSGEPLCADVRKTTAAKPLEFHRLPSIGLCFPMHAEPAASKEIERLRRLNLSHLRLDLKLSGSDTQQGFIAASQLGEQLDVPLDVAITLSHDSERELGELTELVGRIRPRIAHWLVFREGGSTTNSLWVDMARQKLSSMTPDASFVGGTDAYFAELNRSRPDPSALDGVCYSINPQVHASDDISVAETLQAQGETVRSAQAFSENLPIHVGPITLKPRFNPNATGLAAAPAAGELPIQVDPRQSSRFAAGWTLGSIARLAAAGAARLTYFETVGWLGVMESAGGNPLPEKFSSRPDSVYPVYHVLADFAEFAGGEIALLELGRPIELHGLALRKNGRIRLILANLSAQARVVEAAIPEAVHDVAYRVRRLNAQSELQAITEPEEFRESAWRPWTPEPLELASHEVVTLDAVPCGGSR